MVNIKIDRNVTSFSNNAKKSFSVIWSVIYSWCYFSICYVYNKHSSNIVKSCFHQLHDFIICPFYLLNCCYNYSYCLYILVFKFYLWSYVIPYSLP